MPKLKYLVLLLALAFVPVVVLAAHDTVTHTSGSQIYLPGTGKYYTVGTATELESYTVNDNSIDFVVSSGSIVDLSAAAAIRFVASSHSCTETNVDCNTTKSSIYLNCSSLSGTPTITVTVSTCGGGGNGGGGGGGGGGDVSAPAISGVGATVSNTQAVILWTTNEASLSWVVYGLTTAYGSESKTTSYLTSHSLTLTNLSPGTTYHYQVKSKDSAGNTGSYSDKTFTTTGTPTTPTTTPATPTTPTTPKTTTPTAGPTVCALDIGGAYKLSNSKAVYYITSDCAKRPFNQSNVFFTYFDSWKDVKIINKDTFNSIVDDTLGFMPWGPKYDPKYGALVKIVSDPKVYLLLGEEKYWITSEDVFNALSYKWNWIEDIDKALLDKYLTGSEINYTDHHPNYTLVKYAKSPKVYRLEPNPSDSSKQIKRHIKDEKTFKALNFRWDRIVTIKDTETYTEGAQLTQ